MGVKVTFLILYLARRGTDDVVEIRKQAAPSLDHAITIATNAVRNMVYCRGKGHAVPSGFAIENPEGQELYRWYDEAPRYAALR